LYLLFLAEFRIIAVSKPQSETDIMKHFGIERGQAKTWLKQAEREGLAEKIDIEGGEAAWSSRLGA
jgi:transposase